MGCAVASKRSKLFIFVPILPDFGVVTLSLPFASLLPTFVGLAYRIVPEVTS